jgi:broad specificity phosphatase PhoE
LPLIALVRHGQASFGSADYDHLSPIGVGQARRFGTAYAGVLNPVRVVAGTMRRQADTARHAAESAGWDLDVECEPRWNEYEYDALTNPGDGLIRRDLRTFQDTLDANLRAWAAGRAADDFTETYSAFKDRLDAAVEDLKQSAPSHGATLVFTSGGVMSAIVCRLLGGDTDLWLRLHRVCANTAVTRLALGQRGLSVVSFNEHAHLGADLVTYR